MRITWVDNLRWLWIILIVLWHSLFPEWSLLVKYVFSFHVILFFFLSWLLFNETKHTDFRKLLKNKFSRLIIPYLIFNTLMFSFYKIKAFYTSYEYKVTIIQFIKWILYWSYLPEHPRIILANVPTWFLVSLFFVSIFYFFINRYIKNKTHKLIFLFLLSISIFIESKYIKFRLPMSLEISLMATFFYWIWNIYKKQILNFVDKIDMKFIFLLPILIFLNIHFITTINFSSNFYWNNYLLLLLDWFLWVLTFIIISKLIPKNYILDLFWKNSIIILWMWWIDFIILPIIIKLSFWKLIMEPSYLIAFIQIISTLTAIIPIIFIVNKFKKSHN